MYVLVYYVDYARSNKDVFFAFNKLAEHLFWVW